MLKPNCSFVLCRLWPINLFRFAFQCFLLKNKATQANLITEKQGVCKTKFSELRYVSISSSSSWVTQAYQQRKIKHFYSASYFNFLSHSHEQIDSGKWHYPLNRALSVENWINIEKVAPLHFARSMTILWLTKVADFMFWNKDLIIKLILYVQKLEFWCWGKTKRVHPGDFNASKIKQNHIGGFEYSNTVK